MRRAIKTFVLLAVLVGMWTPATAEAQTCYVRTDSYFEIDGNTDQYAIHYFAYTWTFTSQPSWYSFSFSCPTGVNYTEARSWIEGRQPNGDTFCYDRSGYHSFGGDLYGVCSGTFADVNLAHVGMFYLHPGYLDGTWGGKSQHFYNSNFYQIDWKTKAYYISPQLECALRGQPWYWDGDSCEDGGGSPVLVPLRGNKDGTNSNFRLTTASNGVLFDINGDGNPEQMAWTAPGSNLAFVVLDRNDNGVIDDGTELFGNYTLPGVSNGFNALAQIEPQAEDGRLNAIDANDPLYSRLLLWEDRNHNGVSEPHELRPFSDVFASIGTGSILSPREDTFGNRFLFESWVEVRTGQGVNRAASATEHYDRLRRIYDVFCVLR